MENEAQLLALRPRLELPTEHSLPEERFQNRTLRPILKMLHPQLVARLRHNFSKRNHALADLPEAARLQAVEKSIRHDHHFRQSLAGMVIGHFTADEMAFFLEHETEMMRRLASLLVQRLQSVVVG
ncbi:MAG: hypothetical protein JNK89_03325 [Saprospiraceae bacterium]|nr:hypothetical protein [Saprospiraceae bacterium]